MSDSEEPIDNISEGGDDLFGDDPDDGISSPKARVLDDDDLATDPDEDDDARRKRQYSDAPQEEERETLVLDVPTYRHSIPKPTDGIVSITDLCHSSDAQLIQRHSYEPCAFPSLSNSTLRSTSQMLLRPQITISAMPGLSIPSTSHALSATRARIS